MADTRGDAQDGAESSWWQKAGDRFEQLNKDYNPFYTDVDDPDGDGLGREAEAEAGTFNWLADSDGDGVDDGAEVAAGSDPTVDDADVDQDGDGLTNAEEAERGTRADRADSDGDRLPDGAEETMGLDPTNADSDGDGLDDGYEVLDSRTDPRKVDSDGDRVPDGAEDPDYDTVTNVEEQRQGTDPHNARTDGENFDNDQTADEFLSRNYIDIRRTRAEARAREAEVKDAGEQVEDSRYLIVTDPEDAKHASHSALDSYVGTAFAREGSGHVLNNRTDEVEDISTLPDGSTIAKGRTLGGAQVEGRSNLGREKDQNDVTDLRRRKELQEQEDRSGGDDGPLDAKGPPPAGEREPGFWEDGEGEGEAEQAAGDAADPTDLRIETDTPQVPGAGVSLADFLAGQSGRTGADGSDLTGRAPAATPDDPNPVGKAVDPDAVAADRFGGATIPTLLDGPPPGGASGSDGTGDGGAGRFGQTRVDGVGTEPFGGDENETGAGSRDEHDTGSGDGGSADDTDEDNDDGADGSGGTSGENDDSRDEGASTGTEPDVRESINEYDPETGVTTTYYVDESGNVYDQDGNPVPPEQVPDWVRAEIPPEDPPPEEPPPEDPPPDPPPEDPPPEDPAKGSSDGVSTSVDPDAAFGNRTKAEAVEEELGAPDGRPRAPVDPEEGEGSVEGRSLRHLITSDDLAQPTPGEVTAAGGEAPGANPNASGGRFGTGAIDWGPDHVTHETGEYQDESVPEAERRAGDGDGDGDGEGSEADLTPVTPGIALTAEPVNEPEPLSAVAVGPNDTVLAPDPGGGGAEDPMTAVPEYPEVDDGWTEPTEDRLDGSGFEPEPEPVDLVGEPDRFEEPPDLG